MKTFTQFRNARASMHYYLQPLANFSKSFAIKLFCLLLTFTISIHSYSQTYTYFFKQDKNIQKTGVKDENGKTIVPATHWGVYLNDKNYIYISDFVSKKTIERNHLVLNPKGKKIGEFGEINSWEFSGGFFAAYTKGNFTNIQVYDHNIQAFKSNKDLYGRYICCKNFCVIFDDVNYIDKKRPGIIYAQEWVEYKKFDEFNNKLNNCYAINVNNKWGILNLKFEEKAACLYDSIYASNASNLNNNNLIVLKNANKTGFYNTVSEKIIEPVYDQISRQGNGTYIGLYKNGMDILNENGVVNSFNEYTSTKIITPKDKILIIAEQNKKKGLLDIQKKVIIPLAFDSISVDPVNNNFVTYNFENGLKGMYNANGTQLLATNYQDFELVSDSVILAKSNGFWGELKNGTIILPFEYDGIRIFNKTLTLVKKSNAWGALENLKPLVACKYDNIEPLFSEYTKSTLFIVGKAGMYGILNTTKNDSTSFKYQSIEVFKSFRKTGIVFKVRMDSKYNFLFENEFKEAGVPFDGIVKNNDDNPAIVLLSYYKSADYTYYNLETKALLPLVGKVIYPFKNGFARVKLSVLDVTNSMDENFKPVSEDEEFGNNRNCLIVWVNSSTAKKMGVMVYRPITVKVTAYYGEVASKEISTGSKFTITNCYPEDTGKDGYVKFILPLGSYKVYVNSYAKPYEKPSYSWTLDEEFTATLNRKLVQLTINE